MKTALALLLGLFAATYAGQNTMGSRFLSKNFPTFSWGIKFSNQVYIVAGEGSRFTMVTPGLTGTPGSVSFESVDNPGHYIRHAGYVLWLHPYQDLPLYKDDATFMPRPDHYYPNFVSFESINYPNHFIRHQNYRLRISLEDNSELMHLDASFVSYAALPLVPVDQLSGPYSFKSYNFPTYSIGLKNINEGYIVLGDGKKFHIVSPGLSGHAGSISFESVEKPNHYLRHRGYLIYLDIYSSVTLYKNDASFYPRLGRFYSGYTAFESVNFPNHFIRHQGYRLKISAEDGSALMHKDASFLGTSLPQTFRRKFGPFDFPSNNFPAYTIGLKNVNQGYIVDEENYKFNLITPGLTGAAGSVSFEAADKPGYYLRHRGFLIYLDVFLEQSLYKNDATFYPRNNKYFTRYAAFESVNFANHFMRHQGYRLKISQEDNTELMHKDASFMLRQCFPVEPVQFDYGPFLLKSQNFPAYSIGIQNGNQAYIVNGNTLSFRMLKPGLCGKAGTVSFQSSASPNKFLLPTGYLLNLDEYQNTEVFKLGACFFLHPDLYFDGYFVFESVLFPLHYIRHQNSRIKLHVSDNSNLFRRDASFSPH